MIGRIAPLALALLTLQGPSWAAQGTVSSCAEELASYADTLGSRETLVEIESPSGGALYYRGAVHSLDPTDRQFEEIERAFADFEPTLVFYEGHLDSIGSTRDQTIREYGESGFLRYVAAQKGIPTDRLEPAPRDEIDYLVGVFGAEQVKLFYVLREVVRLRDRRGLSESELEEGIAEVLDDHTSMPQIGPVITNLEELEQAFWRYWKYPLNWWEAKKEWFDPAYSSQRTGGIFTNDVSRTSTGFRDLHMYRLLAGAVGRGERVFAAVGRSHVPVQAPALRCALE